MQFTRTAVPQLYQAAPQLLYLLPRDAVSPPAVLSVGDSWTAYPGGAYLFLAEPLVPGSEAAFAAAAWAFLAGASPGGARFAWLRNPGQASAGLAGWTASVYQPEAGTWRTARAAVFGFGSVSLFMGPGAAVTLDADAAVFTFAPAAAGDFFLAAGWGASPLPGSVSGALTLPLSGGLAGCLLFPVSLDATGGTADLETMDVGLRWFYPDPGATGAGSGDPVFLDSLRFPVFREAPPTPLALYASLDPLAPLEATRTFFAFNAPDAGQSGPAPAAVASNYRTTLGAPVSLLPAAAASAPSGFARLVFAPRPASSLPGPADPFYLVPQGDFAIQAAGGGTAPDLMAGLSGVEYVKLAEGGSYRLSFFPGRSAYAAGFFPGAAPGPAAAAPGGPTTSWAAVTADAGTLNYYAQPDSAVFYEPGTGGTAAFQPLSYLEVGANSLAAAPAAASAFPLLPYAGVAASSLAPYRQLELQVVSPLRRSAIAGTGGPPVPPPPAPGPVWATTPQGLLAEFSPDLQSWEELVLAQGESGPLMLTGVPTGAPLRTALQSNQLFLVISDPASLAPYLQSANAQLQVAGYTFDLETGQWAPPSGSDPGTVLIFKFSDKTVADLAGDPSAWVQAADFNQDPAALSAALSTFIQAAVAGNDPDQADFVAAVTSPGWNGILALNVHVPLTGLPAQLEGLAAGVDPAQFRAHHVGIAASVVSMQGSTLAVTSSSVFALIHYQGPAIQGDDGNPYQYAVTSLKVLVTGSALAGFSGVVQLAVNSLFGEAATLEGGAGANVIELFGTYQSQKMPDGTQQDSYTFATLAGSTSVFSVASRVLNAVVVAQMQFVTVQPSTSSPDGLTHSRFIFLGTLDFSELSSTGASGAAQAFDLFSFGREPGAAAPAGLAFANVGIEMDFDPATPGTEAFTFDAGQISFDLGSSQPRAESLYSHFPVTLAGLTQAKQGSTPTSAGFMGVLTPLAQSALQYPWYSLDFDLNLGSLGALAARAGFVATLTAAWSPNATGLSLFVGLRLPDSSGGKQEIDLQGVLKVTFGGITLAVDPDGPGTGFVLTLRNIALSLLSKQFPPSGQINFVLFGDPAQQGKSTSLGWYVAYAKQQTKQSPPGGDGGATAASAEAPALRRSPRAALPAGGA